MAAVAVQRAIPSMPYGGLNPQPPSYRKRTLGERAKSLLTTKDDLHDSGRNPYTIATSHNPQPPSRGGRQFRVGNIGNNGLIYLRPVAGNAQSNTTATQDSASDPRNRKSTTQDDGENPPSPQRLSPEPAPRPHHSYSKAASTRRTSHDPHVRRSVSEPDRSETGTSYLHVPIPNYRLGTPRFSGKGGATIRSSIALTSSTSDRRSSSVLTQQDYEKLFPSVPGGPRRAHSSRPTSQLSNPSQFLTVDRAAQRRTVSSEYLSPLNHAPSASRGRFAGRDRNASQVIVSPLTGHIVAATVTQLINEITSPDTLDYELLSNFFLTYRQFVGSDSLSERLVDRLRWALGRTDDLGRIIRVRTFVALRHWILNYFVDDFVASYSLRRKFCGLVNVLYRDMLQICDSASGNLKILGELKKCWNRTCALYWDVPETSIPSTESDEIFPGDYAGSTNSDAALPATSTNAGNLSTTRLDVYLNPNQQSIDYTQSHPPSAWAQNQTARLHPSDEQSLSSTFQDSDQSTMSDESAHNLFSCSIPLTVMGNNKSKLGHIFGPRQTQANPTNVPSNLGSLASKRPQRHHKRSGSFSDALRDDRAPLPTSKASGQGETTSLCLNLPGSLIRGAIYQPTTPYIEILLPKTPSPSAYEIPTENYVVFPAEEKSNISGSPVVRKLLGNVRRALSTRQTGSSVAPDGRSSIPISPVSSLFTGAPKRKLVSGHVQPRLDILHARVHETYDAAVREINDWQRHEEHGIIPAAPNDYQNTRNDAIPRLHASNRPALNVIDSTFTTGSRSIIIVDDTAEPSSATNTAVISAFARDHGDSILLDDTDGLHSVPVFLDGQGEIKNSSRSSFKPSNHLELLETDRESYPVIMDNETGQTFESELGTHEKQLNMREDSSGIKNGTGVLRGSTRNSFKLMELPAQPLRRRPGRNLRPADHIRSLELHPDGNWEPSTMLQPFRVPPRRSSTGATNELYHSMDLNKDDLTTGNTDSKPIRRISFEREAAKLSQLPDNEMEGGRESALRKLEGRDTQNLPEIPGNILMPPEVLFVTPPTSFEFPTQNIVDSHVTSTDSTKRQHRAEEVFTDQMIEPFSLASEPTNANADLTGTLSAPVQHPRVLATHVADNSVANSDLSFSSVPLLDRGISRPQSPRRSCSLPRATYSATDGGSSEKWHDTDQRRELDESLTRVITAQKSLTEDRLGIKNAFSTDIPPHNEQSQPPPTILLHGSESYPTDNDCCRQACDPSLSDLAQRSNPFPVVKQNISNADMNDESKILRERRNLSIDKAKSQNAPPSQPTLPQRSGSGASDSMAAHVPFILGYDSLTLAQQFTLIEKDALSEVEWRDLIDLRWTQKPTQVLDWVDFLRSSHYVVEPTKGGIDICIARFNLMVRWATSEVVLTQDMNERAACITKYIHIAQHARKIHNWATMYQITVALVSADCARLRQTMLAVPQKERDALASLEILISPTRNFHNLRVEMDNADLNTRTGVEGGCVPFIGLYTHDLIYNSSKPAYIQRGSNVSSTNKEPLINFDRHYAAATIVKSLLRHIEASSKYTFQPIPEVISRCLWMASLSDEEIFNRSMALET